MQCWCYILRVCSGAFAHFPFLLFIHARPIFFLNLFFTKRRLNLSNVKFCLSLSHLPNEGWIYAYEQEKIGGKSRDKRTEKTRCGVYSQFPTYIPIILILIWEGPCLPDSSILLNKHVNTCPMRFRKCSCIYLVFKGLLFSFSRPAGTMKKKNEINIKKLKILFWRQNDFFRAVLFLCVPNEWVNKWEWDTIFHHDNNLSYL